MKKYKQYWFYLSLASIISLTILVINDINDPAIPQILQDINSGVIGAILTTIITLLLLTNQTESQENLTRSSVVYEEKLKIFNHFLDTISNCLKDGKLTGEEAAEIIQSFSVLRIHVSQKNSLILEKAISTIDNSFFIVDENRTPNLSKLVDLYTELANVFRKELYNTHYTDDLLPFDCDNLKKVLFKKRVSVIYPTSFEALLTELQSHNEICHTTAGLTIVFPIDHELTHGIIMLHKFMEDLILEVSAEITTSYEITSQKINNDIYSGIPWIKLTYKNMNFAFYGVSEIRQLCIVKEIPEKKKIASLEFYEFAKLPTLKHKIVHEFTKIITTIDIDLAK